MPRSKPGQRRAKSPDSSGPRDAEVTAGATVTRAGTHARRLQRLERAVTPPEDILLIVREDESDAARAQHPRAHIIEIRERGGDDGAVSPLAQKARDASRSVAGRSDDLVAERRRADRKEDAAGPDPAAREAAQAQARKEQARALAAEVARLELKSRAAAVLDWLGPDAYLAADKLFAAESTVRRIYAASQREYEEVMHAHVVLSAGDLAAPEALALIARVEARYG